MGRKWTDKEDERRRGSEELKSRDNEEKRKRG